MNNNYFELSVGDNYWYLEWSSREYGNAYPADYPYST